MSGKGSRPRPFSVSQDQFGANFEAVFGKRPVHESKLADQPPCYCYNCNVGRLDETGRLPYVLTRMIVCPICGNKRCPLATDHNLACTNSNEPGQAGSRY